MTADQIEKLKALALAATPGPWIHDAEDNIIYPAHGGRMIDICCRSTDLGTEQRDNNAAFVAGCHPAVVLELIAEVERLRADVETRDALLRALNAVAIERGDKFGACDCIDNRGNPYPSQHLSDVLAAGAPATGTKEKA